MDQARDDDDTKYVVIDPKEDEHRFCEWLTDKFKLGGFATRTEALVDMLKSPKLRERIGEDEYEAVQTLLLNSDALKIVADNDGSCEYSMDVEASDHTLEVLDLVEPRMRYWQIRAE